MLRENSIRQKISPALYQGMTLVVPQTDEKERGF
jgi:hypothetical protein